MGGGAVSDIRAVDVPELRAGLVNHMRSDNGLAQIEQRFGKAITIGSGHAEADAKMAYPAIKASAIRRAVVENLQNPETQLYFVSSEMAELAKSAAITLSGFSLEPADLPSPCGFMVFEEPYADIKDTSDAPQLPPMHISAVAWDYHGGDGMAVMYFVDWYRYLDEVPTPDLPAGAQWGRALGHRFALEALSVEPVGTQIREEEMYAEFPELMAPLISTWLLMQQPLATSNEVVAYRASRKRIQRMGQEPNPVRVIQLRRASNSTGAGESDREYHHTWIVRGHWRQQWYPSREVHRPVWIAPHVKGPEGAPLLGGEKVHAWVR